MRHVPGRAQIAYVCVAFLLNLCWLPSIASAQEQHNLSTAPILPLDDVRIGMKGYGLTVFQGTRIEPFDVEVVAVMRNFAPGRGVIWVRCPDERMQKLGPVQGMSGSPIYLWPEADPSKQEPGKGGRLIGAFALGFLGTKDCYVGIQPIQQMRQVAQRAGLGHHDKRPSAPGNDLSPQLAALVNAGYLTPTKAWRARAVLKLARGRPLPIQTAVPHAPYTSIPPPPHLAGQVQQMRMPMTVGSPELAQMIAPALIPLGVVPVCLDAAASGVHRLATDIGAATVSVPPPGLDMEKIRLEPGSVLSVPLAFGDIDISALGTVTEVQPDGRVLAFGHGILGQGPMAVPMATGYVHFVMPSLASSFKLGGSGVIRGAITRDEHSAIVGIPGGRFTAAPVELVVNNPAGMPGNTYRYQVVHHKQLTPFIVAAVVLKSITAQRNLPIENTLRLHGKIRFSGNRSLDLNSTLIDTSATDLLLEVMPVIATMMQNPHESMTLESLKITADIEPTLLAGSIVNAQIDRADVAPGETLGIDVQVQPYGTPPIKQRIKMTIPESLADGDYDLIVCDARTYVQLLLDSRPHMLATSNADDLHRLLQRILAVASDALYAVLQLPESGLAVGRQELPQLPSSRRAMFDTPTSTLATPYVEWIEKIVPMGLVIQGKTKFTIGIRKALVQP